MRGRGKLEREYYWSVLEALKASGILRYVEIGERICTDAYEGPEIPDVFVATAAVDMYAKCGRMDDARKVFDAMPFRDVVAWNALLLGYAVNDQEELAMELFQRMGNSGSSPNDRSFVAGLMACVNLAEKEVGKEVCHGKIVKLGCLEKGMELHCQAAKLGYDSDEFVESILISLYAKCGSMVDAQAVFDKIRRPNVVSWTTLIMGYAESGDGNSALDRFSQMVSRGCTPNSRTFVAAFKACASIALSERGKLMDGKVLKLVSLAKGREIHSDAAKKGFDKDIFVASTLVDMYCKCGSLAEASTVFASIAHRDVVCWTSFILGCAENGEEERTLKLFDAMKSEGCTPNSRTYIAVLTACAGMAQKEEEKQVDGQFLKTSTLEIGRIVHLEATRGGFQSDDFVANGLIGMYAKCGSLLDAHKVFDRMVQRGVVSYTTLMLGYVESGEPEVALGLFDHMCSEGCVPDGRSFVAALMACTSLAARGDVAKSEYLKKSMDMHSLATNNRWDLDIYVATALVEMYSKTGSMDDAKRVFDRLLQRDEVLWTSLMLGYVHNGEFEEVFELFSRMRNQGYSPDSQTFVAALLACGTMASTEEGKQVGGRVLKIKSLEKTMAVHCEAQKELDSDSAMFMANTLVDVYGKCGSLLDSRGAFDRMPRHDVVSWNVLMTACAENGNGKLALDLYIVMQQQGGQVPDLLTLVAVLTACGCEVMVEAGKKIHADICKSGMESSAVVANCLVDFYGKCGRISVSQQLFESITDTSRSSTWNALIAGYSRQGDAERVIGLFQEMLEQGLKADKVTYLSILAACSHAGLVEKGMAYFEALCADKEIAVDAVHYSCMVDLLGRANHLEDAMVMLKSVPSSVEAWTSFLGACGKWGNVELGRLAFETILRLDNEVYSAYKLMANLYASCGMWEEHARALEDCRKAQQEKNDKF